MKRLTTIIVNYNVGYYVEQCLDSLERATRGMDAEVYVVDNHSRDGSIEYLRPRFPQVNFIESNHNLGFAKANNIAVRQTESEYVLFLNPDTFVGEGTIGECLDFLDHHPRAAAVGVQMLRCNGDKARESRRGLPTPATAFYKMCGLCDRFPQSRRFGRYYMGYLAWDEPAQIDVISGAYCLARREALQQVGLLDEDFFMYGEDIDLSYRFLKGGYENWYLPARIVHYKGESTEKSSFRYVHVFYDAMLIFFRKHYGTLGFWLSIPIKTAIYMKAAVALVRIQSQKVRKMLGFNMRHSEKEPVYVFYGSRAMLEVCRAIANRHGFIDAQFVEGDRTTRPDGHQAMELPANRDVCVVYDVTAYGYEDIMGIFARRFRPSVTMGTFNPQTGIIITEQEIIR